MHVTSPSKISDFRENLLHMRLFLALIPPDSSPIRTKIGAGACAAAFLVRPGGFEPLAFRVGEIRRDTQFDDTLRFFLLVLHSGSQNKKKPVVGCHNRLFRCFEGQLHSSGQMVV